MNYVRLSLCLVCESCQYDFNGTNDSTKRSLSDDEQEEDGNEDEGEEDDDDDDGDDYGLFGDDDVYETPMPQNKDKKRKAIEAVEKSMTDEELTSYYNQYLSILKDQRQQTQNYNDKQLREIISQLFKSLQYKNETSEGQLSFRCCQICYDKDEPVITMKVCY